MGDIVDLDWLKFPDVQNTNYNYFTVERLRNAPRKWLSSLPLFEYAYVLTSVTAIRMGGEPERFITDLYEKRLNPVLSEYHKKLMRYRFIRALHMRKYESMKSRIDGKYLVDAIAEIKKETVKARAKMRKICREYELENK